MSPRILAFLIFILLPLAEIYVLAEAGSALGGIATVALVIFTTVLGVLLLRHQGFYTLLRVRASLARGEPPGLPMLEGGLLVVAGVLLLIPGFITDGVGLALLIGPLRRALIRAFFDRVLSAPGPGRATDTARTLEGEYRRED